jgi:hypothetical protein
MKTLDAKLAAIHADPVGALDFILADAKDADMAFGLAATGAEPARLRHFLEVFAPNVPVPMQDIGRFLNDFVARTLAGVPSPGRPAFL